MHDLGIPGENSEAVRESEETTMIGHEHEWCLFGTRLLQDLSRPLDFIEVTPEGAVLLLSYFLFLDLEVNDVVDDGPNEVPEERQNKVHHKCP